MSRAWPQLYRGFAKMSLLPRSWIECPQPAGEHGGAARTSFTVMQWNMLADALSYSAPDSNFYQTPPEVLRWGHRSQRILGEILRSGTDIVCLEEVDRFQDFILPELTRHGFEGTFTAKIDSPCVIMEQNHGPDGCALLYRSSKFSLVEKKEVTLRDTDGKPSHQVAILAKLALKEGVDAGESGPEVSVAVTHLKAKDGFEENRLAQGKHLQEEVSSFAKGLPTVICGDFNAPPIEPVYKHFASEGALKLASAYATGYNGVEPPFTSWKLRPARKSKYTIDYIWYSWERLGLKSVWRIPSEEDIGTQALPCHDYPSDHVALCATFYFQ